MAAGCGCAWVEKDMASTGREEGEGRDGLCDVGVRGRVSTTSFLGALLVLKEETRR